MDVYNKMFGGFAEVEITKVTVGKATEVVVYSYIGGSRSTFLKLGFICGDICVTESSCFSSRNFKQQKYILDALQEAWVTIGKDVEEILNKGE